MITALCFLIGIAFGVFTLWLFHKKPPADQGLGCGAFLTAFAAFCIMAIVAGSVLDPWAQSLKTTQQKIDEKEELVSHYRREISKPGLDVQLGMRYLEKVQSLERELADLRMERHKSEQKVP